MKKKHTPRSAFFNPRVLTFCVAGCSVLTGTLLGFFHSAPASRLSPRTLTFAERVAYQRAIEEVYWRHRIWPKERPDPKPSLDAAMPQAQLERKAQDYLRKSQALENYWQRPITAEQLQTEMDRMAKHTKQPEVLREVFEALGNDPFVIAECLARSALAERSLATIASRKESLDVSSTRVEGQIGKIPEASERFRLPAIPDGIECVPDSWTATSIQPEARSYHTAVWTGSEMIVWGGLGQGGELNTDSKYNPGVTTSPTPTPIPYLNTGARYNPSTDSWTATSMTNVPTARASHTAVWTGSEMIIWGGAGSTYYNSGGRYNATSDTWLGTGFTNAPSARWGHTAVWTGSEMIVWGGYSTPGGDANTGGRYNPITNSWTATTTASAPDGRDRHTAVWTGSVMIVWGGTQNNGITQLNTGGRYNPSTDSWTATTVTSAPAARFQHTGVWSGSEMVVWGGIDQNLFYLNTGGRYNPGTDSWTATSITNAPGERGAHTAIWTGNEMIVWGGYPRDLTGGRYNPGANTWTATGTANAPPGRDYHTAVWTGIEMIVWGGQDDFGNNLNTGGRYCAQFASPTPTPTATATTNPTSTPTPTPTATATATPTTTPSATPIATPTPTVRPTPTARPNVTPRPRLTPPPRP